MDREELRRRASSFEQGAAEYDRLRPEFPPQLVDDLRDLAGPRLSGRVLEIGAGTGRATLPLARRGSRVDVVEPSADMLAVLASRLAREGLADRAELRQARFEDVSPDDHYDVVVAAQSFHWTDPDTRWTRLSSLLRPDGLAFLFWNGWFLDPEAHDTAAVHDVYATYGPALEPDLQDHRSEGGWAEQADAEPSVALVETRHYAWTWPRPIAEYLGLLRTTSQYAVAPPDVREPLLRRLSEVLGDTVSLKGQTLFLVVAAATETDRSHT